MTADIVVRPLSPNLLKEYLAFFDGPAFADNPRWASCYCFFHHNPEPATWGSRNGEQNRGAVSDLIRRDRFHGFLAYRDGHPVGWCNAAPRREIPGLALSTELAVDDPAPIGSIVCFIVDGPHRRSGVATVLLEAACRSFTDAGLKIAEAYPRTGVSDAASNYHGPIDLYLDSGFALHREFDEWAIVRKAL